MDTHCYLILTLAMGCRYVDQDNGHVFDVGRMFRIMVMTMFDVGRMSRIIDRIMSRIMVRIMSRIMVRIYTFILMDYAPAVSLKMSTSQRNPTKASPLQSWLNKVESDEFFFLQ